MAYNKGLKTNILRALRYAPLKAEQLDDRYGAVYIGAVESLIKMGYITRDKKMGYLITQKGRLACPNRNNFLTEKRA